MLSISLLSMLVFSQGAGAGSVADLAWLAGCWKMTAGTRTVTEQWMPPDGGTMLGVSRTVSGGKTVEYEFIVLRMGATGVEYAAHPSGQAGAVFTATKVSGDEAVFENPTHDFPTRITYRKLGTGIVATIDGMVNGKTRAITFRYSATECQ